MKETITLKGHVTSILFNEVDGIKQSLDTSNIVVNNGKAWFIDRIGSNTPATASLIVIGSGVTGATINDTTIESELASQNGEVSQPAATTHSVVATFGPGVGTGTVTEYALYASGAAMIGRIVSGSITKASGDSLQVTYQLTIG